MKTYRRLSAVPLSLLLLAFSTLALSETSNPIEYILSGGETLYDGQLDTTQLFIDQTPRGRTNKFWVRVEYNMGYPSAFDFERQSEFFAPPMRPIRNTVYIKYFPIGRYIEVRRVLNGLQLSGRVNPYLDDFVICDGPDATIRYRTKAVTLGYDCGSNGPDADEITFRSEELLLALRAETRANPDLTGEVPQ